MVKIAIFNQKGGVAKTTMAASLSAAMDVFYKKKILLIDCDRQASLSSYILTYDEDFPDNTLKEVAFGKCSLQEAVISPNLNGIKNRLSLLARRRGEDMSGYKELRFIKAFSEASDKWDYAFFDLPPYLTDISLTVLSFADYVIIPADPDMDSLLGFEELNDKVVELRNSGKNPDLKILGVVFSKVMNRTTHNMIRESTKDAMGDLIFQNVISSRSIVEQARFMGIPVPYSAPKSVSSEEYKKVVKEMLTRIEEEKKKRGTLSN